MQRARTHTAAQSATCRLDAIRLMPCAICCARLSSSAMDHWCKYLQSRARVFDEIDMPRFHTTYCPETNTPAQLVAAWTAWNTGRVASLQETPEMRAFAFMGSHMLRAHTQGPVAVRRISLWKLPPRVRLHLVDWATKHIRTFLQQHNAALAAGAAGIIGPHLLTHAQIDVLELLFVRLNTLGRTWLTSSKTEHAYLTRAQGIVFREHAKRVAPLLAEHVPVEPLVAIIGAYMTAEVKCPEDAESRKRKAEEAALEEEARANRPRPVVNCSA